MGSSHLVSAASWLHLVAALVLLVPADAGAMEAGSPSRPPCHRNQLALSQRFTLNLRETGLPKTGQWRDTFVLADMNGDSHLDIVHGPPRKGSPQPAIFLGDGAGRFAAWQSTHFPPLPFDYGGVAVGDVNGDGKPDLALGAHLRGLTVLIQEGSGSFAPWASGLRMQLPQLESAALFTSRRVALTDWNGDGRLDLVALNEGPARLAQTPQSQEAFALYLNRQGFWEDIVPPQSLSLFGAGLAIGDVDGDGKTDAVLGSSSPGARLLVMKGDGKAWRPREVKSLPPSAELTAVAIGRDTSTATPWMLLAERYVDGDTHCVGLDKVAWTEARESPSYLWSERSNQPIVAMATGDFDDDGHADIAAVREHGELLLFAGGASNFTPDRTMKTPEWLAGCSAYDLHAADLDKDGSTELIISFAGEPTTTGGPCTSGGGFVVWKVSH